MPEATDFCMFVSKKLETTGIVMFMRTDAAVSTAGDLYIPAVCFKLFKRENEQRGGGG
jgi:hypothetical protein